MESSCFKRSLEAGASEIMSLDALLKWDPNLLIIPTVVLSIAVVLTILMSMTLGKRSLLKRLVMAPVVALVAFNYTLAFRSISDIMTKFAQYDLIMPMYGVAVLMMFPFTVNFLKLTWTGSEKLLSIKAPSVNQIAVTQILEKLKECERIGVITAETYEVCRAHLSSLLQ
jgi:hypothetical protein